MVARVGTKRQHCAEIVEHSPKLQQFRLELTQNPTDCESSPSALSLVPSEVHNSFQGDSHLRQRLVSLRKSIPETN